MKFIKFIKEQRKKAVDLKEYEDKVKYNKASERLQELQEKNKIYTERNKLYEKKRKEELKLNELKNKIRNSRPEIQMMNKFKDAVKNEYINKKSKEKNYKKRTPLYRIEDAVKNQNKPFNFDLMKK